MVLPDEPKVPACCSDQSHARTGAGTKLTRNFQDVSAGSDLGALRSAGAVKKRWRTASHRHFVNSSWLRNALVRGGAVTPASADVRVVECTRQRFRDEAYQT